MFFLLFLHYISALPLWWLFTFFKLFAIYFSFHSVKSIAFNIAAKSNVDFLHYLKCNCKRKCNSIREFWRRISCFSINIKRTKSDKKYEPLVTKQYEEFCREKTKFVRWQNNSFIHSVLFSFIYFSMSSSGSSTTDVCDGENLAIILSLYWVLYLIINALIFAVAMYALNRCFNSKKGDDYKKTDTRGESVSRQSSRASLVSREKHWTTSYWFH